LFVRRAKVLFLSCGLLIGYLSLAGCFYGLKVDQSFFREENFKDFQPTVILPVEDVAGHPQSGSDLTSSIYEILKAKGYRLVPFQEVSAVLEEFNLTPPILLSSRAALLKANERLQAKLLLTGTLLEYSLQKSFVRSESFQVWDGGLYEYRTLPTYYQGICQIKLMLRMVDMEKGSVLWMTEGRIRGPGQIANKLGKRLVERLLNDLPALPPQ
jgi:hypothetical protein